MKKKVDAIICNTNMAVPTTLSYVLEHSEILFVILSDTQNIISFFEKVSLSNCIIVRYNNFSKYFSITPKKELLKSMRPYKVINLFFFHFDFGCLANWYLKHMSRKTNIFFCKLYNRKPYEKEPFRTCIKSRMFEYLHYGVWMDYHDGGIPSAPVSFYDKIGSKEIVIPIKEDLIRQVVHKMEFIPYNKTLLILAGSILSRSVVDEVAYEKVISEIVRDYGEDKITVKCHPRYNDMCHKERLLCQIPSFVPGNLLVYNFDLFLGYDSLLLVEAARKGKKAISLLKIIPSNDKTAQIRSYNYLEERLEGKGRIYYPRDNGELNSILFGAE